MKMMCLLGMGMLALVFPVTASARVVINEIAWMGSVASPSDEWIELANTGTEPVDLTGWTLAWSKTTLKLSVSIIANGYYLIERTDDTTVPDVGANLVAPFGHGLSNAGAVLVVKDASGAIVDQVDGGQDWFLIGGSASTKETPQRQQDGTWMVGSPTPGRSNAGASQTGQSVLPRSTQPLAVPQDVSSQQKASTPTPTQKISHTTSTSDSARQPEEQRAEKPHMVVVEESKPAPVASQASTSSTSDNQPRQGAVVHTDEPSVSTATASPLAAVSEMPAPTPKPPAVAQIGKAKPTKTSDISSKHQTRAFRSAASVSQSETAPAAADVPPRVLFWIGLVGTIFTASIIGGLMLAERQKRSGAGGYVVSERTDEH